MDITEKKHKSQGNAKAGNFRPPRAAHDGIGEAFYGLGGR